MNTSTLPAVVTAVHDVDDVHVTPTAWSLAGAVAGAHAVPLYDSNDPVPVAATQNVESGHETATGPPVAVILVGLPHEMPFHMTASPVLSTNMQNEDVGHDATADPCDPLGGVSKVVGADHTEPFHFATPSIASVATQKAADAQAILTAAPVRGLTV